MKSPFPGMDPYIEQIWESVHSQLIAAATGALNEVLPPDLVASPEQRIVVETEDAENWYRPDVHISGEEDDHHDEKDHAVATKLMAPLRLVVVQEPRKERYIKVLEVGTEKVITVIEFISPSNKSTDAGMKAFRKKRDSLLADGVNLVEIDLTRQGDWEALLLPHTYPRKQRTEYRTLVRVYDDPGAVHVYPMSLRDPLLNIPIPLRSVDATVPLKLQELVDDVYLRGRLHQRLKYDKPCDPPLGDSDAAWAKELIAKAGR